MHKRKRLGLKGKADKNCKALKAEARKRAGKGKGKPPPYGSADKPT